MIRATFFVCSVIYQVCTKPFMYVVLFISSSDPIKEVLHYFHWTHVTRRVWVTAEVIQWSRAATDPAVKLLSMLSHPAHQDICTLQMSPGPSQMSVLSYSTRRLSLAPL